LGARGCFGSIAAVKAAVMLELAAIQNIDEFLERTRDDKDRLREQIAHLTSALETNIELG